jgi:hypothetical protein
VNATLLFLVKNGTTSIGKPTLCQWTIQIVWYHMMHFVILHSTTTMTGITYQHCFTLCCSQAQPVSPLATCWASHHTRGKASVGVCNLHHGPMWAIGSQHTLSTQSPHCCHPGMPSACYASCALRSGSCLPTGARPAPTSPCISSWICNVVTTAIRSHEH